MGAQHTVARMSIAALHGSACPGSSWLSQAMQAVGPSQKPVPLSTAVSGLPAAYGSGRRPITYSGSKAASVKEL